MEQAIIVYIILGLAVGYVIRTFVRKYKSGKSGSSGCGCSECGDSSQCSESMK